MATALVSSPVDALGIMASRAQIGIDRLPVRRATTESKEAMNCKSCRKRKIKCNRLKPSCEACQVFNCACIYDAVPKKRGPKTDVLEALLKRVNGLERKLKDEKMSEHIDDVTAGASGHDGGEVQHETRLDSLTATTANEQVQAELAHPNLTLETKSRIGDTAAFINASLDTYFSVVSEKPYYILAESATRKRFRDRQLPQYIIAAIHAVTTRFAPENYGGYNNAVRASDVYASQARAEIDVDEPNIDHLQALLLLAMAGAQSGRGKRSYMLLSHAISMAFALNLHRELPAQIHIPSSEREGRRKLFWTCYVMDRFTATGSKRPALISDDAVALRQPAWFPPGSQASLEGNIFQNGSNMAYASGVSRTGQGSGAMLVDIVRTLGLANRYLAAGGVKSDTHFPWHAQSTLSKIRADLDLWAANTQDSFSSLEAMFSQPESIAIVMSKLIYHLVHCLIYRPFLPVDLNELSGANQHQSWQIEATNLCFMHANAIAELVEIGKNFGIRHWPAFTGYCICTAGTIHVHGMHYLSLLEGDLFRHSADFLSRELEQLYDLRHLWTGVQHQYHNLQAVYTSHAQLVHALGTSPMRFSPVFQMEDFFDRYPDSFIDGAHLSFADLAVDRVQDGTTSLPSCTPISEHNPIWTAHTQPHTFVRDKTSYQSGFPSPNVSMRQGPPPANAYTRPAKRRRTTEPAPRKSDALAPSFTDDSAELKTSVESEEIRDLTSSDPSPAFIQPPIPLPSLPSANMLTLSPTSFSANGLPPHTSEMGFSQPITVPTQISDNAYLALQSQTLTQSALSPTFTFSPIPFAAHAPPQTDSYPTPGGASASNDSTAPPSTDPNDEDPFLCLLEQLSQSDNLNSGDAAGGPVDLSFYLNGGQA